MQAALNFGAFGLLHCGFCLSDLFITTHGNGNVQVKKMECDICKVQTERGNCLLHSVKVGGTMTLTDTEIHYIKKGSVNDWYLYSCSLILSLNNNVMLCSRISSCNYRYFYVKLGLQSLLKLASSKKANRLVKTSKPNHSKSVLI